MFFFWCFVGLVFGCVRSNREAGNNRHPKTMAQKRLLSTDRHRKSAQKQMCHKNINLRAHTLELGVLLEGAHTLEVSVLLEGRLPAEHRTGSLCRPTTRPPKAEYTRRVAESWL